jgi:hypothetical protein
MSTLSVVIHRGRSSDFEIETRTGSKPFYRFSDKLLRAAKYLGRSSIDGGYDELHVSFSGEIPLDGDNPLDGEYQRFVDEVGRYYPIVSEGVRRRIFRKGPDRPE